MTVCALMRPSKSSTSALMLNPPTNIALRICTIPGVLLQEFWGRIWSFRRSWLMLWASFGSWMAVYWRSAFWSSTSSSCVWSRSAWCETFLHHFPTKFIYSFEANDIHNIPVGDVTMLTCLAILHRAPSWLHAQVVHHRTFLMNVWSHQQVAVYWNALMPRNNLWFNFCNCSVATGRSAKLSVLQRSHSLTPQHSRSTACALLSDHDYLLIQAFFQRCSRTLGDLLWSNLFRNDHMCHVGQHPLTVQYGITVRLMCEREREITML